MTSVDKIACRGIIIDKGQMLIVKLNYDDNFYCLPGGKIGLMESLENCIIREIKEELGIESKLGKILFINQGLWKKHKKHALEFFFLIENGEDFRNIDLSTNSHGYEVSEIRRINLGDNSINLLPDFLISELKGMTEYEVKNLQTKSIISY